MSISPHEPRPDTCELVGVQPDGTQVLLGTVPTPVQLKAREIIASHFGHDFDQSTSGASLALAAVYELLTWMAQQQTSLPGAHEAVGRSERAGLSDLAPPGAPPPPGPQHTVWPPASLGKLMSMAIRSDHALAMPGYYDQPLIKEANHGLTHAQMLEAKIRAMRQVYEEASGRGFWSPDKDKSYRELAVQILGNSTQLSEFDANRDHA